MADVGYAPSQRGRKELEEGFGWCKTIEGLAAAAYNLVRLRKLLA